ncbi:MAG: SGNH/GDSL hydrolase family protein [Ilumatobacteraceae bacterium]
MPAARTVASTLLIGAVAVAFLPPAPPPLAASSAPAIVGSPSRYTPVGPVRLADTRNAGCGCTRLDASTIRVQIAGRDGIGTGVTAAAVTITATRSAATGFVTVHPAGTARPETSILNLTAGHDTANSGIVPLSASGAIDVYANVATDLVVDVTGTFTASASSRAGRFTPVAPARLRDTRSPGEAPGGLAPGGRVTVALPPGVAADATAVAVNVTSVEAPVAGFLTAFPAGTAGSDTSFMNPDGSGGPRAAAVIVPVSPAGFTIAATSGGHVIVDLVGWFTGPSAPSSSTGLFVPTAPTRVLDTRHDQPRVWRAGTRELGLATPAAGAIVTNVTITRSDDAGFVTAYPAGTPRPDTSTVNATTRDDSVPNLAITRVAARGTAYFSDRGTDLIVDITGYFSDSPVASPLAVPANDRPPSRVLIVGDSTLAAVRFVTGSQDAMRGFDPVLDAEPCRRLIFTSCLSNTTFRVPNTAYEAITTTPGWIDVVVIMTGYNDWFDDFGFAFDTIVGASRAKGARQVVWLTYSEGGESPTAIRAYRQNNADLWAVAALPGYADVAVADWNGYSHRGDNWVGPDGIHLTTRGAYGLADYFSRWIAHLEGRPCTAPWAAGGPLDDPCPNPDGTGRATDIRSVYGI